MTLNPQEVEYFITALRERLLAAERVQIDMRVGVTRTPNDATGLIETRPNRGTTVTIELDGGARDRDL